MNIAVVGLGLIGGSIAKACKQNKDNTVYGLDIDKSVILKAKLVGAIDQEITAQELSKADIIIVALYLCDTVKFIKENAQYFAKGALVFDCVGTKRTVDTALHGFCKNIGLYFLGAHPMAGREFSGFNYATGNLFENASILLTPSKDIPLEILARAKKFWANLGFSEIVITTGEKHDKIIAYTSQLAHVVSNAYVKSPTALQQSGYSAGSYKDMTRVAKLNVEMWKELFLDNKDNLVCEIEILQKNLEKYKTALKNADEKMLKELLQEGVNCKETANK